MKKLTLIFIFVTSLTFSIHAQNQQWLNYTHGDAIYALAEEGNDMWVGTRGGLVRIDKTTGVPTFYNSANSGLPSNSVGSIAIDGTGTKWMCTYVGLIKFDGTSWTTYNTSNSGLPSNYITTLAIDGNGVKWIGSEIIPLYGARLPMGLTKFDDTNWTTYNTSNSGLPGDWVNSVAIDGNGTKWIGTDGGLAAYNEEGIPVWVHENVKKEHLVNVYPNPSSTQITIELPTTPRMNTSLTIYNLNGQKLITQAITEPQTVVDISRLPSGIYFVKVMDTEKVMMGKVVKE